MMESAPVDTGAWSVRTADTVMKQRPDILKSWGAYDDGVVLLGLAGVWERTGEERYLEFVKARVDNLLLPGGGIRGYNPAEYNIDHVHNGRLLLFLYGKTGERKYREAAALLRSQLETHPRTAEGGFWHKQVYAHQMWLDGLYMGSPFYAEYGALFDEPQVFDDVAKQFRLMYDHARDPETGLLYHGWDESGEQPWADRATGCSPNFWGRAMGWYAMGLADALDFFPESHPGRPDLRRILTSVLEAVLKFRDSESGLWYQVLDQGTRSGNYLEASASAMFIYAVARAVKTGCVPAGYLETARESYRSFIDRLVEPDDGSVTVKNICKVAGLGKYRPDMDYRDGSFAYYIGEPVVRNDSKGVGAFLRASLQLGY